MLALSTDFERGVDAFHGHGERLFDHERELRRSTLKHERHMQMGRSTANDGDIEGREVGFIEIGIAADEW